MEITGITVGSVEHNNSLVWNWLNNMFRPYGASSGSQEWKIKYAV
jgi:tetrahydromethanopterin S-methyltransferase subunit H